jgi:hypothetical protein
LGLNLEAEIQILNCIYSLLPYLKTAKKATSWQKLIKIHPFKLPIKIPWAKATLDIISLVRTLETSFWNRSEFDFSKLSMHFFKLELENLICLPLVPKLIKNQSANIWKLFDFCYVNTMAELSMQLFKWKYSDH